MSDLRPKGIPISLLDGVERDILFTLAVVDEIQDHYDLPIGKVMVMLIDPRETYETLSHIALALINDSIRREGGKEKDFVRLEELKELVDVPMAKELLRVIMQSYGYALPNAEEDEDPNSTGSRSS